MRSPIPCGLYRGVVDFSRRFAGIFPALQFYAVAVANAMLKCEILKSKFSKSEFNKLFSSPIFYPLILTGILAYSFLLRLTYLYPHYFAFDVQRDYLIANHIITYHEFPLLGPPIGGINGTTAFYYYFLALFLAIYNNLLSLHFINICFQVFLILLVFLIAKSLFSQGTAILASIFFGFSNVSLSQSAFMYLPYLSQIFIYISYLFLILFYLKRKIYWLIICVSSAVVAGALYGISFPIVLIVLILAVLALKKHNFYRKYYLIFIFTVAMTLLIVYLPTLIFIYTNRGQDYYLMFFNKSLSLQPDLFKNIYGDFITNTVYLTGSFFYFFDDLYVAQVVNNWYKPITSMETIFGNFWPITPDSSALIRFPQSLLGAILFLIVAVSGIIYFFKVNRLKIIYVSIILIALSVFLIFISIIQLPYHALWHFNPVVGLLVILVAEFINTVFSRNNFLIAVKVALVFLIIQIFAHDLNRFNMFNRPFFGIGADEAVVKTVDALKDEIVALRSGNHFGDFNFFQIKKHARGAFFIGPPYFLTKLEQDLNIQLVKISNGDQGYEALNKDDFIFLLCDSGDQSCPGDFNRQFVSHSFVKDVYVDSRYHIYLTQKQ